jgi:type VI secretion system secreted protein Hcp
MKNRPPGSTRKAVQIVVAAGVALGAAPALADDVFLKIPGIPGESANDKHKNEIDVLAFSLQVGGKQCPTISLLKKIDRATPPLAEAVAAQQNLQSATISVARSGEKSTDYYRLALSGVVYATSEDQSFSSGGEGSEAISLSATSMTIGYKPQKPDGSLDAEITRTIACGPGATPGKPGR